MIKYFIALVFCFSIFNGICQTKNATILSIEKQNEIFSDEVKANNNISYPIYKVFEYQDKTGKYYAALTESMDEIKAKDTSSKSIKAIILKEANGLEKITEINDNIINNEKEEYTIYFWTKYTSFEKVDGLVIPIIVYGSKGMNDYLDGRIKIIVWYNNQKIAIRHQNGVLDGERLTKIDKAFYTLPQAIKTSIKNKMKAMEKANHAIFGNDWELNMKKQKTEIKG